MIASLFSRRSSGSDQTTPTLTSSISTRRKPSLARLSTFSSVEERPKRSPPPSTPQKPFSPASGMGSPAATPAWMKPLHLVEVDDDKSIFMNVHGEEWRDHSLCLYCFRQHGNFHRVQRYGCEVCGREEILKNHYWEEPY